MTRDESTWRGTHTCGEARGYSGMLLHRVAMHNRSIKVSRGWRKLHFYFQLSEIGVRTEFSDFWLKPLCTFRFALSRAISSKLSDGPFINRKIPAVKNTLSRSFSSAKFTARSRRCRSFEHLVGVEKRVRWGNRISVAQECSYPWITLYLTAVCMTLQLVLQDDKIVSLRRREKKFHHSFALEQVQIPASQVFKNQLYRSPTIIHFVVGRP